MRILKGWAGKKEKKKKEAFFPLSNQEEGLHRPLKDKKDKKGRKITRGTRRGDSLSPPRKEG